MFLGIPLLTTLVFAVGVIAEYTQHREREASGRVTVTLALATVHGSVKNNVETFGGIPFAEPPVGSLRLRPPKPIKRPLGVVDATGNPRICHQMLASTETTDFLSKILGSVSNLRFVQNVTGQSEDCLTITVTRPQGTKSDAKIPVMFYIFGGGFELGWSSMYDGTGLVNHGVSIGKPFIYVVFNYRVAGYGFMPGKEIMEEGSGNIGLLDQRMALEWVADNIAQFGGDPSKVTIWGSSSGAISVIDQMILFDGNNTYKGKPLFRGAIMNSGTVIPADPLDCPKAQAIFDQVVKSAGCPKADALACLRSLDSTKFLNAVTSVPGILSPRALALSYLPRPDGKVITASPDDAALAGKYAAVPMIMGDQEDEGTLFALFQPNLTTTDALVDYLKDYYFNHATKDQMRAFVDTYGEGISAVTKGSPFGTGLSNEIFPGFKRRAAILGDVVFTLTRRATLRGASGIHPEVPSWSYLASYDKGTPILGTFHGSDIFQVFLGTKYDYTARSIRTYFVNFLYSLDPNAGSEGKYPAWARWADGRKVMNFRAYGPGSMIDDDFRQDSYEFLWNNRRIFRF